MHTLTQNITRYRFATKKAQGSTPWVYSTRRASFYLQKRRISKARGDTRVYSINLTHFSISYEVVIDKIMNELLGWLIMKGTVSVLSDDRVQQGEVESVLRNKGLNRDRNLDVKC